MLQILGLSPTTLLVVAGLTFIVWWYYRAAGDTLETSETAVVVVGLAILTALCQALWRLCCRLIARRSEGPK